MMRKIYTLLAVLFLSSAIGEAQNVFINEIQTMNIDQNIDPSFNYGGWIELYNTGSTALNVRGWWLSDDPDNLKKAKVTQTITVAAGGFATLWFDNYDPQFGCKSQIDMKLDCDGGTIFLSDANGTLVASVEYPAGIGRCSWARTTDGGNDWGWTGTPTPTASNNNSQFCTEQLPAPTVNIAGGIFSGTASLVVDIPEGCTLRYTSNGTTPTATTGTVSSTGRISTTSTHTYKLRLFRDGYLPSPVVTRTMIANDKNFTLPVVTITSSNDNFYGNTLGIFCRGSNGRPGRGQSSACNWNMDWERPAAFTYILPDGTEVVNMEAGVERCGGWSRAWLPYSFKICASKRYNGENFIAYPFFQNKPYLKHKALQVRNGGNDNGCRMKDPGLQEVVLRSGLYIDGQSYQPVAHYVNGVYKGTINLREPNNKDYAYANYGLDDEELDAFEMSPDSNYVQVKGTKEAFTRWYTLSKTCSSNSVYEQICEMVDIDEYINYMAVLLYLGNTDWPQNNVKGFKSQLDGGKFHIVMFDLDHSFGTSTPFTTFANKQNYTFDQLYPTTLGRRSGEIQFVSIFLNMLSNAKFRKQFIDTFCLVAGSVFEPTRCRAIIEELCNTVAPMQNYNEYSINNAWDNSPWNTGNTLISNLSASRQTSMISQLKNYNKMQLSGKTAQRLTASANIPQARLWYNDLPVPTNKFSGQVFAPVTLRAEAPAGYRFEGWYIPGMSSTSLLPKGASWRYYDKGSLDGTQWYTSSYNGMTSWGTGAAPLGYFTGGTRDYQTTLSYGSNANAKYPTYYFRKTLNLTEAPAAGSIATLDFVADDGFILYINGTEVGRYNMPTGNVSFNTYASTYAEGNPDSGSLEFDASLFKKGSNIVAVELHNNSASSTDIYWDASIQLNTPGTGEIVSTDLEYAMPTSGNAEVMAFFVADENASRSSKLPVVINEVSAGNDIYVNEYWKKNDWIELYNATDETIDLSGMYLTDNVKKPQKWQISAEGSQASTLIPAHGFKIIWCDKLESQTQLHAPFKLDNADESVLMLTAADGSWSDTLVYCAHAGDETVGRYPDGSDSLFVFNRTTPEASNQYSTSNTFAYLAPRIDVGTSIEQLEAETSLVEEEEYEVYDLQGKLVATGRGLIRVTGLPSGIYIVRRGEESMKIVR